MVVDQMLKDAESSMDELLEKTIEKLNKVSQDILTAISNTPISPVEDKDRITCLRYKIPQPDDPYFYCFDTSNIIDDIKTLTRKHPQQTFDVCEPHFNAIMADNTVRVRTSEMRKWGPSFVRYRITFFST